MGFDGVEWNCILRHAPLEKHDSDMWSFERQSPHLVSRGVRTAPFDHRITVLNSHRLLRNDQRGHSLMCVV